MKKLSIIGILLSTMIGFAACSSDEEDTTPIEGQKTMTFTASANEAMRTMLDNNSLKWSTGDAIWINGEQFTLKSVTDDGKTGTFEGTEVTPPYIAFYPYNENITLNGSELDFSIPTTQRYATNSLANASYPMLAASNTTTLSFANKFGGIKLRLKGSTKIAKISVQQVTSGSYYPIWTDYKMINVNTSFYNTLHACILGEDSATTSEITLDCTNEPNGGVLLNTSTSTPFYISFPPLFESTNTTATSRHLKFTIIDTDGKGVTKEANVAIKENEITVFPEINFDDEAVQVAGRYEIYQTHTTTGDGINLFFTADGYTASENVSGGTTRQLLESAAYGFFNTQPYTALKNYFNVYFVYADSPSGAYIFNSQYNSSDGLTMDDSKCHDFVKNTTDIDPTGCVTIIAVKRNSSMSNARSVCTMVTDGTAYAHVLTDETDVFQRTVQHEGGGHGFANLADEYVEPGVTGNIFDPQNVKWLNKYNKGMSNNAEHGCNWYCNMYLSTETCKWQNLINNYSSKYTELGNYEGGFYCQTGTYRPTNTSIMNVTELSGGHLATIEYFNAPSRAEIYKRVMTRSGSPEKATDAAFVDFENTNGITITKGISLTLPYSNQNITYRYDDAPRIIEAK